MIPLFKVRMSPDAKVLAGQVLDSGYVGQGPVNTQFEHALSDMLDTQVLTLNSCTSALDLALFLCGVGPGDEVISTPMTCTASNGVIVNRGATIVWADILPWNGLINADDVYRKVTSRTAAIMAVDWAGQSCNYHDIRYKTQFDVPIIEDAAHHIMANVADPNWSGDYVCWSFQAIKHLTTVDGGAIMVPPDQYTDARLLRWYGLDRDSSQSYRCEQDIHTAGFKYHMNDLNSAIGLANLPQVPADVAAHRANARYYQEELDGLPGITLLPWTESSSWWLFSVLVDEPQAFMKHMAEHGVEANPVHARNDRHTAFRRNAGRDYHLPGVDAFADHQVAIPVGWWLDDDDREQVARAVQAYSAALVPQVPVAGPLAG